jgi:hypothetical protein
MTEQHETEYEVSIAARIPVKRLVRVKAYSESHARRLAIAQTEDDAANGIDQEWCVPQVSRSDVVSDQVMLGPSVVIHHEAIQGPIISGMCPTKVMP